MADSTLALDVLKADGKKAGSVELPAALFDVKTNIPLIHQVVVAQRAAARQGTHSTKRRGEVSGAGRKPFKQKGTGNARQGSIRAPHMTGGGIVHGPKPRDYSQRTPKKMIAAALLGALSDRARGERLHVIESFGIEGAPSTKAAAALPRRASRRPKNVLVVIERSDDVTRQERPQPRVRARAARSTSSTPTTCSSPTTSSSPRPPRRVHRVEDRRHRGGLGMTRPADGPEQGPARHHPEAGRLREELRAHRRGQVHLPRGPARDRRPRSSSPSRRSSASRSLRSTRSTASARPAAPASAPASARTPSAPSSR